LDLQLDVVATAGTTGQSLRRAVLRRAQELVALERRKRAVDRCLCYATVYAFDDVRKGHDGREAVNAVPGVEQLAVAGRVEGVLVDRELAGQLRVVGAGRLTCGIRKHV